MTTRMTNAMLEAIHALERAPSVLKVQEVFRLNAERHGIESFLCSAAPTLGRKIADPGFFKDTILFKEWSDAWSRRYAEERHHLHDPIFSEAYRTADPFLWSEAVERRPCSKAAQRVMSDAAAAKMNEGFVVPIYGVGGALHLFTMAGEAPRTDTIARAELHLLSIYAYGRAKQLRRQPDGSPVSLTSRERDALFWASLGKTDWEIGEIMFMSESAAHKLIESAKRKCNVPTRIQAVVVAIRQGDIPL
jgi:LuxR family quorum sensing-dependent transcriptional regulator